MKATTVEYSFEWREHGRWNRSDINTATSERAKYYAEMICGASTFRIVMIETTVTVKRTVIETRK